MPVAWVTRQAVIWSNSSKAEVSHEHDLDPPEAGQQAFYDGLRCSSDAVTELLFHINRSGEKES
jgi:hypothetical protein